MQTNTRGEMMIEKIEENNLQIEPNKKFFTAQARRAHVREYQASNESMIAYCDKHHLSLSTFKTWVTKYGEKKIPAAFVPIVASKNISAEISKSKALPLVEIHVNNIKIIFPEISDTEVLIQLIRGLSHANPTKSASNIVL